MLLTKTINEKRKDVLRKKIMQELKPFPDVKILDNGCGVNGSWDYKKNQAVTRCDILFGIDCQERLPFIDGEFDIVVFSNVIQYVKRPDRAMKECKRVLANQGLLIISTINLNSIVKKISRWKDEVQGWRLESFKEFVSSFGFKVIEEAMIDFGCVPSKYKMIIYLKCVKERK